ncbi:peroxiredoxin [Desulfovibrio oxyclinae]|uniref:peroxiredoxin n=1 Tax=Desulfovibrio oxyclinae TaxID=63560 RepID=UPI00035EA869|nr:peroxiredoxin [Desulfovibrio oxyclinae]
MRTFLFAFLMALAVLPAHALEAYPVGQLKPVDSEIKVHPGDLAPDFELPSTDGETVRLSDYRGNKNVLLTFVPAAWTPVCSDQWPGYNIALDLFAKHDTVLVGISIDNTPSQWAWEQGMNGIDFPILSDFWPHGATADSYGILRSDGMSERALILVDKEGIVRWTHVNDVNGRPDLKIVMEAVKNNTK